LDADAPDSHTAQLQSAWLAGDAPVSLWPGAVTIMPFAPPGAQAPERAGEGSSGEGLPGEDLPGETSSAVLSAKILIGETVPAILVPPGRGDGPYSLDAAATLAQPAALVAQPAALVAQPTALVTQPAALVMQPAAPVTQPAALVAGTESPSFSPGDSEFAPDFTFVAASSAAGAHPGNAAAFFGTADRDMAAAGLRAGHETGGMSANANVNVSAAVVRAGSSGLEGSESGTGWDRMGLDRMSLDRPGALSGLIGASSSAAAQLTGSPIVGLKPAVGAPPGESSLATILGERLHYQITRRGEHAVMRLDPPSMGSIEILIRHEAGGLQVQLRASHAEVARQLQGVGESLRQDLAQRQHGEVSVLVHDGARDADGRQRQRHAPSWQETPGRALGEGMHEQSTGAFAMNAEA